MNEVKPSPIGLAFRPSSLPPPPHHQATTLLGLMYILLVLGTPKTLPLGPLLPILSSFCYPTLLHTLPLFQRWSLLFFF